MGGHCQKKCWARLCLCHSQRLAVVIETLYFLLCRHLCRRYHRTRPPELASYLIPVGEQQMGMQRGFQIKTVYSTNCAFNIWSRLNSFDYLIPPVSTCLPSIPPHELFMVKQTKSASPEHAPTDNKSSPVKREHVSQCCWVLGGRKGYRYGGTPKTWVLKKSPLRVTYILVRVTLKRKVCSKD